MRSIGICRLGAAALLVMLVAGCGSSSQKREARLASPQQAATGPLTAKLAEDIWHLRSGLNVAALSCRGRDIRTVHGGYNRMLKQHSTLLADAMRMEEARYGVRGFDSHSTQVYNRFANIRNHRLFCAEAADIVARINATSSAALPSIAPGALRQLESALRAR